jgi:hypothetical protein
MPKTIKTIFTLIEIPFYKMHQPNLVLISTHRWNRISTIQVKQTLNSDLRELLISMGDILATWHTE